MRRLIGNTPLLSLALRVNGEPRTIYAKYEPLNLTGSIKDLMALHILQRACETGLIAPALRKLRDIPFAAQVPCSVEYKGQRLHGFYKLDFVCYDGVVVEVKASSATTPADYAQVLNYLAVSGHEVAVLINFGRPSGVSPIRAERC